MNCGDIIGHRINSVISWLVVWSAKLTLWLVKKDATRRNVAVDILETHLEQPLITSFFLIAIDTLILL